jgi:hypothetical protein
MTTDIRELLPIYAAGACDPDERKAVEAAVDKDPALAAELAALHDAAAVIAAAAPRVTPSAHVKARLLASVGGGRFERLAQQFGAVFDVALDRARELLGWIEDPSKWKPSGLAGINAIHFAAGPACAGADTGLLELAPGAQFPWHEHVGDEVTLVLAGAIRDHDGKVYGPGDELVKPGKTQHDYSAEPGATAVIAVRAFGVKYGLVKPDPDD